MKTKSVRHITTDEEHLRLKIYDGEIQVGDAGAELLKLVIAQHYRSEAVARLTRIALVELRDLQRCSIAPWPVKWYRYIFKR